jgi:hypothetical protein
VVTRERSLFFDKVLFVLACRCHRVVGRVKDEGMMMNWLTSNVISATAVGSRDLHTYAVSNSKPPVPTNCQLVSRFRSGIPADYAGPFLPGPAKDHGIRLFDEGL